MISIDFETRSEADLRKTGSWVYSLHSTTEILCLAVKVGGGPTILWTPEDLVESRVGILCGIIERGELVEAHNAFFEKAIWQNIMVERYGWPEIKPEQWRCSASTAAYHALPRSLGGAGAALELDVSKDGEGRKIMLQLCKPRKKGTQIYYEKEDHPEKFNTLYEYCKSDVEAEHAISQRLGSLPKNELAVWQLDQKINMRGVPIDIEAVDAALKILGEYSNKLCAEIDIITEGTIQTIGQRVKILEWCESRGEVLKGLTKDDVTKALLQVSDPKVRRLLEIRQALSKTSTAKYEAMKKSTAPDGRVRDTLKYHGASTGRWTGQLIQLQNLPRGNIKDMATAVALIKQGSMAKIELLTGDVMGFMSSAIRGMISASEGKQFLVADFSAIEARVLGWLAGSKALLNKFREGECVYCSAATDVYGFEVVKEKNPEERQVGKTLILAFGYQGGVSALQTMASSYGVDMQVPHDTLKSSFTGIEIAKASKAFKGYKTKKIKSGEEDILSEEEGLVADILKQRWRKANPEITSLWYGQQEAAHTAVRTGKRITAGKMVWFTEDDFLKCELPSGRHLHYYKPQLREKETDWGLSTELSYMAEKNGKAFRNGTYGGKLVENITQAVARDLMADAMIRIEKAGATIVLSVHDELIAETPISGNAEVDEEKLELFCKLMAQTPGWATDCPVEAEGWTGINYKK